MSPSRRLRLFVAFAVLAGIARDVDAGTGFGPELAGAVGTDLGRGGWGLSAGPALRLAPPIALLAEVEHAHLGGGGEGTNITSVAGGVQLRIFPRSTLCGNATIAVARD